MCPDNSQARYSCVVVRFILCVALVLSAAPVFAQTLAGGAYHTVFLKSDGTVCVVNHLSMPNALVRAFIKETTNSVAKGGAALIEHTKTMSHGVKQLAKNPFGGTNATFCSSR